MDYWIYSNRPKYSWFYMEFSQKEKEYQVKSRRSLHKLSCNSNMKE